MAALTHHPMRDCPDWACSDGQYQFPSTALVPTQQACSFTLWLAPCPESATLVPGYRRKPAPVAIANQHNPARGNLAKAFDTSLGFPIFHAREATQLVRLRIVTARQQDPRFHSTNRCL